MGSGFVFLIAILSFLSGVGGALAVSVTTQDVRDAEAWGKSIGYYDGYSACLAKQWKETKTQGGNHD